MAAAALLTGGLADVEVPGDVTAEEVVAGLTAAVEVVSDEVGFEAANDVVLEALAAGVVGEGPFWTVSADLDSDGETVRGAPVDDLTASASTQYQ
ncbi:hypothetical protein PG997_004311 [Apiospora hydei]|uniref:Uncharacterized protein n=1 Tax=Apiospora hydei TaxID=1337664 RepID=A0ABR1X1V0_9PEZI